MASDDKVKPLKYLDVYPKLPIDAPIGYPHIIDLDSLDHDHYYGQELSIVDAVATRLFRFSPGILTAFLDLDRPKFLFIQGGKSEDSLDLCIKRDGRTVKVGFLNGKKSGGWSDQHRYRIDGKVTETWRSVGFRVSAIINETDAKEMLEEARRLAYYLLIDEPCHAEFSDQPIEVVCGLSRGRKL